MILCCKVDIKNLYIANVSIFLSNLLLVSDDVPRTGSVLA